MECGPTVAGVGVNLPAPPVRGLDLGVNASGRRVERRRHFPWSGWTIGHELTLLVLVTLIPFAALGVLWAYDDYHAEQARTQARALRLAHEVSAEVDQFVDDTAALVEAMARVPSVKRAEDPQTGQLLGELVQRYPYYESLFVADATGQVLASGGADVAPPGNRLAYVQEALRTGGTVVTNPIAPRNTGRHVFVVATPLWDESGKPVGVVGASVNLLRLQEGLRRAELPENSSVLIVDLQGRIVARRTAPEEWVGRSALDSSAVRNALRAKEGVSEGDFVDGVRRLSGFAGARRVPWEIVVGIPTDEAYGALRRELLRWVARLLVAGAITAVLTWLLGRRLTRPMVRLANAVHIYAAGDLAHRVPPSGPEEIASLGATFNTMAEALQQQMADLQAAQQREREAGVRALAELRRLHSEFIAIAAHELRTPVAAAKSYAELLQRDDADLPATVRRQALLRLDAVCERLARLVRSLLGASRIQAGRLAVHRTPVDLVALASRVVDDFSAYTPTHEVRLVPTLAPDAEMRRGGDAERGFPASPRRRVSASLTVLGDSERMEDVLVNLLANAAKYSPDGTPITVRLISTGDFVDVEVEDLGPGIPPEEQEAVFERFRRGRGVAGQAGIGLGLYIAQAYVQAMGGEIGVRSAPGHGATFWFRLPGAPPGNDAAANDQRLDHAAVARGLVPRPQPAGGAHLPPVLAPDAAALAEVTTP